MDISSQSEPRSIEVTGLPDEAIRALEELIAVMRNHAAPRPSFATYDEWSRALREWAESHPKRHSFADWSRDSIYDPQDP